MAIISATWWVLGWYPIRMTAGPAAGWLMQPAIMMAMTTSEEITAHRGILM
jgi:hypothetical protein